MVTEESIERQSDPGPQSIESKLPEIGSNVESLFSPRFKSVAAMAGWDEEALLFASLIVDDTPERELRNKKRSDLQFKSPPTGSRRKRRTAMLSIPVAVLDLDEGETTRRDEEKKDSETAVIESKKRNIDEAETTVRDEKKDSETAVIEAKKSETSVKEESGASLSHPVLPCIDKLREELSCAICLEICFEPSTTSCGHSFCKKCLRSAADKCGKKCPKCRQLISNGRSCTVNTVLWNTIQLLFPKEVEARREAKGSISSQEKIHHNPEKAFYSNLQNRNVPETGNSSRHGRRRTTHDEDGELDSGRMQRVVSQNTESRARSRTSGRMVRRVQPDANVRSRRGVFPDQDEDAALALRLQREEFMDAFRDTQGQTRRSSLSLARANLRAMATRAVNLRINARQS